MDSSRARTAVGKQAAQYDSPEQLLDVFKAAALSVTKLYKTSAKAEARARADGYQECLDELLMFLDKENIGLDDGEGWRIRRWATERLDGRDAGQQSAESEDEVDKGERNASPEIARASTEPIISSPIQIQTRTVSPPAAVPVHVSPMSEEPTHFVVPTQEAFTFHSSYPNIATLDLSDQRPQEPSSFAPSFSSKFGGSSSRGGPRSSPHLGRGAGTKRRMDFDDFFGGCLGGKDPVGNGSKRSRHT
ncbi:hypothetical protein HDV57DRAFT_35848 [Trichoderma longibrachiatum]|uniref:Uncharacterized protein n=1 Tax=Trichoderma longibrachiatum ATCC 18648 TaxID=983965 RepID=A0A2T4CHN1_TRILO|nr:hypothetical protein M440DRAFT_1396223 [Trichoderma longibrachiatum ATCC 18648]